MVQYVYKKGKESIMNTLALTLITVVAGLLLGLVYEITKEPIAKEQQRAKEEALEGARLLWEKPEDALDLITNCFDKLLPSPCEKDSTSVYHTKFIVKRDQTILKKYLNIN